MASRPRSARSEATSHAPSAPAAEKPSRTRATKRPTVEGLGDDVGAADLARRVAESLRRYRAERRMSLDQLALSSGVSRAALSQIEGARTNPTLGLMWKVAVGLGIPFQALLGTGDGSQSRVLRAGDAIPLRSTDGRMESRLLSPSGSGDRIEVYELRFQAKGFHRSEPHAPGSAETVIVLTGALRVVVGDESHELAAGDTLYFVANHPHSYENRSSREARCIDIIAYGRS
jgi:transcriptional regulator with XRE-family HTH domain